MKKMFNKMLLPCLIAAILVFWFGAPAAAEEPKYGGHLKMINFGTSLNFHTPDVADWDWKHGFDTGLVMEHLFMGDLQKGPRGTKEYSFTASAWIPPIVMRGELVERWEVEKDPLALAATGFVALLAFVLIVGPIAVVAAVEPMAMRSGFVGSTAMDTGVARLVSTETGRPCGSSTLTALWPGSAT